MNEKELIKGCIDNDRYCRKQLYEQYSPVIYAICLRYSGDREEAKDLMHDSFIKIFDGIKGFKNEGTFEGWLKRIAVNTAINRLKRKDIMRSSFELDDCDSEPEDTEEVESEISEEKILEFVTELPDGYRTVFNMHAVEDYSHKDIAEKLNIKIGTSLSQYAKAKNVLAGKINDYLKQRKNG